MPKGITQKTGDANVDRQGQTAQGKYGDEPNVKGARNTPRDLKP